MDALDDSFYSISSSTELSSRVTQMVAKRVPEAEILAIWLDKIGMTEYLSMFLTQGYDLASIGKNINSQQICLCPKIAVVAVAHLSKMARYVIEGKTRKQDRNAMTFGRKH